MPVQIQFRRGTAAAWTAANTVLADGEIGLETDTRLFKIGNGSTAWTSLAYGGFDGAATLNQLDITSGTDIGANLADADEILVYDDSASVNKKSDVSRIPTYVFSKVSGDITVGSDGTAAVAAGAIVDADINASAAIALSKLASGSSAQVIVANSSGVPTYVSLSGSATISNTGVITVITDDDQNILSNQVFS